MKGDQVDDAINYGNLREAVAYLMRIGYLHDEAVSALWGRARWLWQ